MKKFVLALVLLFLALPSLAAAQSRFEGLVVYRFEMNGQALIQKSWTRGDSVVIEAQPPMPVKQTVNFASGEYRIYSKDESNFQKAAVKSFDAQPNVTPHLKAVQQFDTINGKFAQLYQVVINIVNKGKVTTSFWLTKDFNDATRIALVRNLLIGGSEQAFRDIAHEILALGLAPVGVTVSADGKNQLSMTVVSATEQKIPNDKFAGL